MTFGISRRRFLRESAALTAGGVLRGTGLRALAVSVGPPLSEVGYGQVAVHSELHQAQVKNVCDVLMGLSDDSLLMPFRKMAGKPAPGADIGGWYQYLPDYDYKHGDAGLAPGHAFGQWMSALSRIYATSGTDALRARVVRLNGLLAESISTEYFAANRFPAYCFDKLVCGLKDAAHLTGDSNSYRTLARVADMAESELPRRAVDREAIWRASKGALWSDLSWTWDESYTLPENLYLVSEQIKDRDQRVRYRRMAEAYLDDKTYFDPLVRGEDVLAGKQAYSYVNALCSAMQAYLVGGSQKHLLAAENGFDMLERQSFATAGWGPDEQLRKDGGDTLFRSLTASHNSFEAPCGSYAHMKLTRYLLRATRSGRYGDSMERVMYNAALGALPLKPDGQAFYSADYSDGGRRVYSVHRWPCCSGTLPQLAADYGINAYFRETGAVWINLYLASTFRFVEQGAHIEILQEGGYPSEGHVRLHIKASKAVNFVLKMRVPAWATAVNLKVNKRSEFADPVNGFLTLRRSWRTGDIVEMEMPMTLRLQSLDPQHLDVAALICGPRVLFALGPGPVSCTREQALKARQVGANEWQMETAKGPVRLVPFTGVADDPYSTYLRLL